MKKTKKTSKAYFNRFKASFLEWQERLGLTQYATYFHLEELPNAFAQIHIQQLDMIATVTLSKTHPDDEVAEDLGRHEAVHLLIHRLKWLGEDRYIASSDLMEECEAIVMRLEKVL